MAKMAAFGTLLKRGLVTVAYVQSITGPGLSLDTEDVTTHDSTGAWEEHVGTVLRSGEISLDIEFDPSNATQNNTASGLLADMFSRVAAEYSITFPDATVWSFSAFVTGFEPSAPHDGALTASVKMKLTGQPTLGV